MANKAARITELLATLVAVLGKFEPSAFLIKLYFYPIRVEEATERPKGTQNIMAPILSITD